MSEDSMTCIRQLSERIRVYYHQDLPPTVTNRKMKRLLQGIFLLLLSIGIPLLIIRRFDFGRKFPDKEIGREIYTRRKP